MNRRSLLLGALDTASLLVAKRATAAWLPLIDSAVPIIDAHIHLFNPRRPGGIPWPAPDDPIYKPSLPARYESVVSNLGVVGAIAIEASPLPADNDWVLKIAAANQVIVGMVGDLVPGSSTYEQELDRLQNNLLFLGIRYGNLWGRNLALDKNNPGFMAGLRSLATRRLVFESANPDAKLIEALLAAAQMVPDLTIVIDHLPHMQLPQEPSARKACWSQLAELSCSPHVFVKLSEILTRESGSGAASRATYAHTLDSLWDIFGPEKVLYGSDWPNSDHVANYVDTLGTVRTYVATKGREAMEKFFWKNSIAAYNWKPRRSNQHLEAV
jgi:predicted TIM-barrel fold metal-dependent hydrolase